MAPWPVFGPDEIEASSRVLASGKVNYWTGSEGRLFEEEFARYVGTRHSVALTNGTVALELALRALGIGPGDEVILTPRSFVASASAIVLQGATPIFADVDLESGNITCETIDEKISPRTRAILAVHLGGWPCDMPSIMELARKKNLKVVEDCAQAHGASVAGKKVGSFGDISAWSFCQDKIMSTGGEGGMVTLDDSKDWEFCWSFKDHGKSYDAVHNREHAPGFRWVHEDFGTNWRLTEPQSAIGRCQLRKLDGWNVQRAANAQILVEQLSDLLHFPVAGANIEPVFYRLYGRMEPNLFKEDWNRERVISELGAVGIKVFSGSCCEMYLEKAFEKHNLRPAERLPNARRLGEQSIAFLVHPSIETRDMELIADVARQVLVAAKR